MGGGVRPTPLDTPMLMYSELNNIIYMKVIKGVQKNPFLWFMASNSFIFHPIAKLCTSN